MIVARLVVAVHPFPVAMPFWSVSCRPIASLDGEAASTGSVRAVTRQPDRRRVAAAGQGRRPATGRRVEGAGRPAEPVTIASDPPIVGVVGAGVTGRATGHLLQAEGVRV